MSVGTRGLSLRNALFRAVAERFPCERIAASAALAALWRVLLYGIRPTEPFIMRTRHYRLRADPSRQALTRAVIRRGHWEPRETQAFIRFLSPGDFVIDAGANFGHYALTASNLVGAQGWCSPSSRIPRRWPCWSRMPGFSRTRTSSPWARVSAPPRLCSR